MTFTDLSATVYRMALMPTVFIMQWVFFNNLSFLYIGMLYMHAGMSLLLFHDEVFS